MGRSRLHGLCAGGRVVRNGRHESHRGPEKLAAHQQHCSFLTGRYGSQNQTLKTKEIMKYLFIAIVAMLVVTGCKTHESKAPAGAPEGAKYGETSNDRHAVNRVSNNLRGDAPSFGR